MSAPLPSRTLFPWHLVLLGVGGMLLVSGLCCGLVSVRTALEPATPTTGANSTSWWLFVGLVVVPMLITAVAALWLGWRQLLLRRTTDQHHQILRLADHHGHVTAADVARDLMLPLPTAEQLLDQLASAGICRMELSPEGTTMFIFPKRIIP
jgi:DNA-binding transcriptional ArsR family regulator